MKAAFLGLLLIVGILATGCSGGADGGETLDLADIGWTENTAIAHLTKVLLEEEVGYEQVTIHTSDLDLVYDSVAKGDLDAFQDVWLPNQRDLHSNVQDDVEQLNFSYQGQTEQGIGVPSYMNTGEPGPAKRKRGRYDIRHRARLGGYGEDLRRR